MFHVKHHTKETGNLGEDIAANYLIDNGYNLLFRNYKEKVGEIDIVAAKNGKVVIIEVKTIRQSGNEHDKSATNNFLPEDHLNAAKVNKLKKLAQMFHVKHSDLIDDDKGIQIDLIAIEMFASKHFNLRHYENI